MNQQWQSYHSDPYTSADYSAHTHTSKTPLFPRHTRIYPLLHLLIQSCIGGFLHALLHARKKGIFDSICQVVCIPFHLQFTLFSFHLEDFSIENKKDTHPFHRYCNCSQTCLPSGRQLLSDAKSNISVVTLTFSLALRRNLLLIYPP